MIRTNTKQSKRTVRLQPRSLFRRPRRSHDPMLVLNMTVFNSESGWNRILNRLPSHENVWG